MVDALLRKYDVLKDKLLAQSLIDQFGNAEWDRMSEKGEIFDDNFGRV